MDITFRHITDHRTRLDAIVNEAERRAAQHSPIDPDATARAWTEQRLSRSSYEVGALRAVVGLLLSEIENHRPQRKPGFEYVEVVLPGPMAAVAQFVRRDDDDLLIDAVFVGGSDVMLSLNDRAMESVRYWVIERTRQEVAA